MVRKSDYFCRCLRPTGIRVPVHAPGTSISRPTRISNTCWNQPIRGLFFLSAKAIGNEFAEMADEFVKLQAKVGIDTRNLDDRLPRVLRSTRVLQARGIPM